VGGAYLFCIGPESRATRKLPYQGDPFCPQREALCVSGRGSGACGSCCAFEVLLQGVFSCRSSRPVDRRLPSRAVEKNEHKPSRSMDTSLNQSLELILHYWLFLFLTGAPIRPAPPSRSTGAGSPRPMPIELGRSRLVASLLTLNELLWRSVLPKAIGCL
jgi:hypothetical protein